MCKSTGVLLLALFLGFLPKASASGENGYIKGNGGVGIEVDGRLRLLDFEELEIESPYIGPVARTDISFTLKNLHLPPEFPLSLLARKLSDISVLYPTLAAAFIKTLQAYRWEFQDEGLGRTEDMEPFRSDLLGKNLILIACRQGWSIRFDRNQWLRLSLSDRTGLIIHELFYSMALILRWPSAGENEEVSPFVGSVRQNTANLFKKDLQGFSRLRFSINLPWDATKEPVSQRWTLRDGDPAGDWKESLPLESNVAEIGRICEEMVSSQITRVQSCVDQVPLSYQAYSYDTDFGEQTFLRFYSKTKRDFCEEVLLKDDKDSCIEALQRHREAIISDSWGNPLEGKTEPQ